MRQRSNSSDGVHVLRKPGAVEIDLRLLVDRDVAAADLGFEALDLLLEPSVRKHGRVASLLPVDQVLANEDIARLARLQSRRS